MENRRIARLAAASRHEVSLLDPAFLHRHQAWRQAGHWRGCFNIAAWFRFPEGLVDMVQLMLCFRDQERRKSYLIDRCLPNRQTLILLNGIVDLDVVGEVADVSLYLTGLPDDAVWMLDACHIEPRQPAILETRRVSSSMHS